MSWSILLTLAMTLPVVLAQTPNSETVLGVYMFHRHGDRTAKSTPPANLTTLGYREVFTSGDYYRSRYIAIDAPQRINGMSLNVVDQSQIAASAPFDTVLQNSATGFLQGLYPPVGATMDIETLGNGTNVTAPLQGYQLIPVSLVTSGSGSEDNGWLQSASGCASATISSNEFFSSAEYIALLSSTQDFYNNLTPALNSTFINSQISFKNAYTIFDYINVGEIHNGSITKYSNILTNDTLFQLRTLADTHEWALAYNSTNNMRAITGKVLAGQIVQFFNSTISTQGSEIFGVQFGAYGTFSSFFGLADLPSVNSDFYGIADYASSMAFELFTNSSASFNSNDYSTIDPTDIYVRFVFHNGTASNISEPVTYPLFGSNNDSIRWSDFTDNMNKFAVGSTQEWCTACGNFTGSCSAYAPAGSNSSSTSQKGEQGGNGLSPAVNGVIGAMVALGVILGLEMLIMLVAGLRVVSKKRMSRNASEANGSNVAAKI